MINSKPFLEKVIHYRNEKKDPVKEFAIRNKDSPINIWCKFVPFSIESFNNIFNLNIDGVKLKFKYVTFLMNGRHKNT